MAIETDVAQHYGTAGIADRILAALKAANGPDAPITVDALSVLDHFHGRGIVATKELVELLKPEPGEHLLDIGSGIGGPSRWFAAKMRGLCDRGRPDRGILRRGGSAEPRHRARRPDHHQERQRAGVTGAGRHV
jgi:hypothetical protein